MRLDVTAMSLNNARPAGIARNVRGGAPLGLFRAHVLDGRGSFWLPEILPSFISWECAAHRHTEAIAETGKPPHTDGQRDKEECAAPGCLCSTP